MSMTSKYHLHTLVWELTMGCNLRCKHCGSSCKERLADELTEQEAMNVVNQIITMQPDWITLSGGEPLLRSDWAEIAKVLKENHIGVRMITNGTLLNKSIAKKMKNAGLDLVSISIDGTEDIHDSIRGKGIFQKVREAFANMHKEDIIYGVNTTVMKDNIENLEELYQELVRLGVHSWQLQPGLPEGNLSEHPDSVLDMDDIKKMVDFSYKKNKEGKIRIFLAETIGYYSQMETVSRMMAFNTTVPVVWHGCNAGIRTLGILHNGDIVGCTSIRKRNFVEGNLKERSLFDIWNDNEAFKWRRKMTTSDLGSRCKSCKYSLVCMGGCSNVRLIMNGDLKSDNPICLYADNLLEAN
ncbi:MAG: radical SAM protein [Lachnospiraceae bacterium]|nr:radical SAM protein [Lachnospiraceae bacterium]